MQIDFIDLLKQSVSSIVLEGETQHLLEKNQALNSFYPILLSILNSRKAWYKPLKKPVRVLKRLKNIEIISKGNKNILENL